VKVVENRPVKKGDTTEVDRLFEPVQAAFDVN